MCGSQAHSSLSPSFSLEQKQSLEAVLGEPRASITVAITLLSLLHGFKQAHMPPDGTVRYSTVQLQVSMPKTAAAEGGMRSLSLHSSR